MTLLYSALAILLFLFLWMNKRFRSYLGDHFSIWMIRTVLFVPLLYIGHFAVNKAGMDSSISLPGIIFIVLFGKYGIMAYVIISLYFILF
ncbi:hypothetical protein [Paenisporosarcina cavernae]|uniref:Uncharacterized protein n=1 Tax=Paenisporosarcina cavernae TaxID=2320858 RepID=A0A385YP59_9BACL|nr:hypothetical protein [Paenisporosarcina cavernae]AYC28356.1 hypothetical protein D3873_00125 [Paenisporosarcina cavernae]AYC30719.1 hypothetical protein D3873_13240 [Paenisporosarcina cavernae]